MFEVDQLCPLCDRPMIPGPSVSDHHLIPRLKGGKDADPCHRICHSKIHSVWDENQLRDTYNTWEVIRKAPEMQSFIKWVRKKPADYYVGTRMARSHKRKRRRR